MTFDLNTPHRFIDASATLGQNVRVWWFAVILADVHLADDVQIGSGSEIGRGTVIGARSRVGAHVFLPPNSIIGADVFIGPGACFADDRTPTCQPAGSAYDAEPPVIASGAVIGMGAVVLPGVRIGKGARIAAGAIVTTDVADGEMVRGEPARVHALGRDW